MEPQSATTEATEASVQESSLQTNDLDSLEAKLDEVLGDVVETIPTVQTTPTIPTFELGAPPTQYTEVAVAASEVDRSNLSVEELLKLPPLPASSLPAVDSNEFHTISGGPETLKETMEKTLPAVHRMTPVPHVVAATQQTKSALLEEEKEFLSTVLFFWFSAVSFISFVIGFAFPIVTDFLLARGFLVNEEEGIYKHGVIAFPSAFGDNMLTLTLQITSLGIITLIITGSIDYVAKKQFGSVTRFCIHAFITVLVGYVVFHYAREQGVTFEQVRQVFLVIQDWVNHILQNIRDDKPVFS